MIIRTTITLLLLMSVGCTRLPTDNGILQRINATSGTMKYLPSGSFLMGTNADPNALPLRQVSLSGFRIDSTEVTQERYQALMHFNPSTHASGADLPVENITWFDAVLFCNVRSNAEGFDSVYRYTAVIGTPGDSCTGLTGWTRDTSKDGYRLPTEAEWEYACRATTTTQFYWGNDSAADSLVPYSWSTIDAGNETHAVAGKLSNAWGLYDMSGNVSEWCEDWYYPGYTTRDTINPRGPTSAFGNRVVRGGSMASYVLGFLQSGYRDGATPESASPERGFRCVRK